MNESITLAAAPPAARKGAAWRWLVTAALIAALLVAPLVLPEFRLHLLARFLTYAIIAVGLDIGPETGHKEIFTGCWREQDSHALLALPWHQLTSLQIVEIYTFVESVDNHDAVVVTEHFAPHRRKLVSPRVVGAGLLDFVGFRPARQTASVTHGHH